MSPECAEEWLQSKGHSAGGLLLLVRHRAKNDTRAGEGASRAVPRRISESLNERKKYSTKSEVKSWVILSEVQSLRSC